MHGVDNVTKPGMILSGNNEVEHVEQDIKALPVYTIDQLNAEIYLEALHRYPNDECIDREAEKRVRRKIDRRILPLLGICYFFYVSTIPSTGCRALANQHGHMISMLIRLHYPMQLSLALRTTLISMALNIPGSPVSSISAGSSGLSRRILSCNVAHLAGILLLISSCGELCSCAKQQARTSALWLP